MAVQAYVFIETSLGKPTQVCSAIAKLPEVKMAHAVTGSYDVIAFVEVNDVVALGEFISHGLHQLPGVLKTTTNIVVG